MTYKKFIIVEGKDDKDFFENLLDNKDNNIKIEQFGGKTNITTPDRFISHLKQAVSPRIKSEIDKLPNKLAYITPKLLIICDADNSYRSTRIEIEEAIKKAKEEFVFEAKIFILPLNKNDDSGGDLESLILEIIENSNDKNLLEIKKCAEHFNKCTKRERITQTESKFILHSMLIALTKHDDRKYSATHILTKNKWFFKTEQLTELKNSIEQLL